MDNISQNTDRQCDAAGGYNAFRAREEIAASCSQQRVEVGSVARIGMTFGAALEAIKGGNRAAREGWNEKDMFVFMSNGGHHFSENREIPVLIEGIPRRFFDSTLQGASTRLPTVNMRTTSGSTLTGWLASQSDMLAEDWMLV